MAAMIVALMACAPIAPVAMAAGDPARSSARAEEMIAYRLRPGESIISLARRYMLHERDYAEVQRLNHVTRDRNMPVGSLIHIPMRLLRAEPLSGRLVAFRGDIQLSLDGKAITPVLDAPVAPGTALGTGAGGFLTLELSNGSRITMPSNSHMRIMAMRRYLLNGKLDLDFLVEDGRIETGVSPIPPEKGSYRVRTPRAVSAVRGTVFRVAYDGAQTRSLTEVIEGTVAFTVGKAAAVPVTRGFGASAGADGSIVREQLLPGPEPVRPGRVQVDPHVALALKPVAGADSYHIQIGRDAGFVDILTEARSATPELRFEDIDNGAWFVRATAIAASGLEGLPTVYGMRRALTGLAAQAGGDAQSGWTFKWAGSGSGERVYHFELRPDAAGSLPLVDEPGLTADSVHLSDLPPGKYLWRVGVRQYGDGAMTENWLPESALLIAGPDQ